MFFIARLTDREIRFIFEGKQHDYLLDVVGTLSNGKPFITEAGMEDDKQGYHNLHLGGNGIIPSKTACNPMLTMRASATILGKTPDELAASLP